MFSTHERPEWAHRHGGPGGPHSTEASPEGRAEVHADGVAPSAAWTSGPPSAARSAPGVPVGADAAGDAARRMRDRRSVDAVQVPGEEPGPRPVGSGWPARSSWRPGGSRTRPRRSWSWPWRAGASLPWRRPARDPRAPARGVPPRIPDHPGDLRALRRLVEAQPGLGLPDRRPAGRRGPGPHREGVRPHGRAPDRGGPPLHRGARRRARRGVVAGRGGRRRRVRRAPPGGPRAGRRGRADRPGRQLRAGHAGDGHPRRGPAPALPAARRGRSRLRDRRRRPDPDAEPEDDGPDGPVAETT